MQGQDATEVYVAATLGPGQTPRDLFAAVAAELRARRARILQERVFAAAGAAAGLARLRCEAYGGLCDGVEPTWLTATSGRNEVVSGMQVHAIAGGPRPSVLREGSHAAGRLLRHNGRTWLTASGITSPAAAEPSAQADDMLRCVSALVRQAGGNMHSVARTWMWLGDVLSWYPQFNRVRNEFFVATGLIKPGVGSTLPASTGIGIGPANGRACAMEAVALIEPSDGIEYFLAGGNQQAACSYGSAFSRAARIATPAGRTLFISGTAAIDAAGATTHVGDIGGQIGDTLDNVRAVLRDFDCSDDQVVQCIAYCKTPEVLEAFRTYPGVPSWPWITLICDVCRPELLFEIEATAIQRA